MPPTAAACHIDAFSIISDNNGGLWHRARGYIRLCLHRHLFIESLIDNKSKSHITKNDIFPINDDVNLPDCVRLARMINVKGNFSILVLMLVDLGFS